MKHRTKISDRFFNCVCYRSKHPSNRKEQQKQRPPCKATREKVQKNAVVCNPASHSGIYTKDCFLFCLFLIYISIQTPPQLPQSPAIQIRQSKCQFVFLSLTSLLSYSSLHPQCRAILLRKWFHCGFGNEILSSVQPSLFLLFKGKRLFTNNLCIISYLILKLFYFYFLSSL